MDHSDHPHSREGHFQGEVLVDQFDLHLLPYLLVLAELELVFFCKTVKKPKSPFPPSLYKGSLYADNIYHVEGIAFKSEEDKAFPLNKAEMSTLPEISYKALVRELNVFNNREPGIDEIRMLYKKLAKGICRSLEAR